ncbi:MAG: enoyl-CoA hydratase [Paracoccaceae bacterium]|jgi:enoyl-CoA hydratase|nr:enoyl-CoA hydratase [Paracoccaceae bacterium]MDG1370335.1 enoyl-CoA hydratase [Paracoccaceae bacterium]MDG1972046.1 enoyl-CoA hydratase [Paracoccaceae bacterium]
MSDEAVLVERKGRVGVLTINRPKALNALNSAVLSEMLEKAAALDADKDIGCIVITGNERAFAAGADIKEMSEKTYMDMYYTDHFGGWDKLGKMRTPKIAAVNGFALGGGCELAMICDFIIAGDGAKFGQPEIKLGVIPGMGGSQRMAHAVGKAKAMDLILTGRMMDAEEAERSGLVSRIVPADDLLAEALKAAETIASYSKPSTMVAKEAVDRAFEVGLAEGLNYERRTFFALFATEDQTEGMEAFIEKRPPNFKHK